MSVLKPFDPTKEELVLQQLDGAHDLPCDLYAEDSTSRINSADKRDRSAARLRLLPDQPQLGRRAIALACRCSGSPCNNLGGFMGFICAC